MQQKWVGHRCFYRFFLMGKHMWKLKRHIPKFSFSVNCVLMGNKQRSIYEEFSNNFVLVKFRGEPNNCKKKTHYTVPTQTKIKYRIIPKMQMHTTFESPNESTESVAAWLIIIPTARA